MRLEQNMAPGSQRVQRRLIAGIAFLLLVCSLPQVANAQQPKKKIPVDILITDADIRSLGDKLNGFDRQLSREELGAMGLLLRRAASAPADSPEGTDVRVAFFSLTRDNPRLNGSDQQAIVVQGGRTQWFAPAGTPGGQPPYPVNPLRDALGGNNVSIGPKHEDPMPAPETINGLETKLRAFGDQLSPTERGIMDWLLQRAGMKEVREAARETGPPIGSPGGLPPLAQALGTDPNNPNRAARWVLRF